MKYPKQRKRPSYGMMECTRCGAQTERLHPSKQKYCPQCSALAAADRSRKWAHTNGKRHYEANRTQFGETGIALSVAERLDIDSSTPPMPQMSWYKRVGVPFSWAGSKNHIFSNTSRGHVFMRHESRYMRSLITAEVVKAIEGVPLVQNKLWIDIYAQKPRANGDAVNFVDMVCDAIKDGMFLDDRWFSIRAVDWQITKRDPMLFVGLGQETTTSVQACSSCGRLLTFDNFQSNRSLPNGIGRNCRDCMLVKSKRRQRSHKPVNIGVFG